MWLGWSRHADVHNSNHPFQYRANHNPVHRRCSDCLNPDVVMNQNQHGQCGATRGPLIPFPPSRRRCNLSECHFGKAPNVDPGADPKPARQSFFFSITQPSYSLSGHHPKQPQENPIRQVIDDPQHLICIVEPAGGVCTRCVIPSSGGTKLGIWTLSLSVDLARTQTSTARSRGLEKVKLDRHVRHRLSRGHRQLLGLPRSHHPSAPRRRPAPC